MRNKSREWLARYIPAEICATAGSILGALIILKLTNNRILAAYAATLCENTGFYLFIGIRDFTHSIKHKKSLLKTLRNLILEFGPAEFLDTFIIRPFWMYTLPLFINNYALGIFTAKIVADITFYIPTIISYELRKKHLKD